MTAKHNHDMTTEPLLRPRVGDSRTMTFEDFAMYHYRELSEAFDKINSSLLQDKGDWDDFVWFCYRNSSKRRPKDLAQVRQEWYQENMQ